jgi:hypothetical protein
MHKRYRLRQTELGGEVRGRAQVAISAAAIARHLARMPAHVTTSWGACRSARSRCRCWWNLARLCTTRRTRVLTKASIRPEVVCPTAARNPWGEKNRQHCRCSLRLLLPPIRTIWPRITSSRKLPWTGIRNRVEKIHFNPLATIITCQDVLFLDFTNWNVLKIFE